MSWLDDLRNRKKKNAGSIKVVLDVLNNGDPLEVQVPLKYPTGKDKAMIVEAISAMEKEKNTATIVVAMDEIDLMLVKHCIDDTSEAPPTTDELTMLVRESGGRDGNLVKRCAQLLGLSQILNIERYSHDGNITKKTGAKRGR